MNECPSEESIVGFLSKTNIKECNKVKASEIRRAAESYYGPSLPISADAFPLFWVRVRKVLESMGWTKDEDSVASCFINGDTQPAPEPIFSLIEGASNTADQSKIDYIRGYTRHTLFGRPCIPGDTVDQCIRFLTAKTLMPKNEVASLVYGLIEQENYILQSTGDWITRNTDA